MAAYYVMVQDMGKEGTPCNSDTNNTGLVNYSSQSNSSNWSFQ